MGQDRMLALTGAIYDAAAGGTPWTTVAGQLSRLLGAERATLMIETPRLRRPEILWSPVPPEGLARYQAHFHRLDLWTNRARAWAAATPPDSRPRAFLGGEHLVPDAELLRSEFYTDFCRGFGLRHVLGTVVRLGDAGYMPIGLQRPPGRAPFSTADRERLEAVLPHLARALQLRDRLGPRHRPVDGPDPAAMPTVPAGLAALDALPTGVLVVGGDARVVLANQAAEALLQDAPLRLVRLTGGGPVALVAAHRTEAAVLTRLIAATAAGGPGGALRLSDAAGLARMAVLASPLPTRLGPAPEEPAGRAPGLAMLLLRDLAAGVPPPRAAVLRDLFGLTAAEAEVARALAGGATKAAVAAGRGARETTIRTQVRGILDKTGAASLRELERLLASLQGA